MLHTRERSTRVVCICGSTRFRREITDANRRLTFSGKIVVAPGVFAHDGDLITTDQKAEIDWLHLAKIDLADEVFVVNPGGYTSENQLAARLPTREPEASLSPSWLRSATPASGPMMAPGKSRKITTAHTTTLRSSPKPSAPTV